MYNKYKAYDFTWYVETGDAAMNGVIDVWAIMRLVEILYGEE